MVAHATKKALEGTDDSFDVSKARLVGIGPRRAGRLSLASLREAVRKTQAQVAKASGLSQPQVSNLETAESLDDHQVSTVRRYLQALGDDLELVATSKLGHRIGIAPPARHLTVAEAAVAEAEPQTHEAGDARYTRGAWALNGLLYVLEMDKKSGEFGSPASIQRAFYNATIAWGQLDSKPPVSDMKMVLDTAAELTMLINAHTLFDRETSGSIKKVAALARKEGDAHRKSWRRRPVSEDGERLVKIVASSLASGESSETILFRLQREIVWLAWLIDSMGLKFPVIDGPAKTAKAVKVVEKHRRLREGDGPEEAARHCVQHVLEAFGATRAVARNAAGLKNAARARKRRRAAILARSSKPALK